MSSDFIASVAVTGHPNIHDSYPPFSVFVPQFHLSLKAVTAAGNRCPAPPALSVSVEGATTMHCTA